MWSRVSTLFKFEIPAFQPSFPIYFPAFLVEKVYIITALAYKSLRNYSLNMSLVSFIGIINTFAEWGTRMKMSNYYILLL